MRLTIRSLSDYQPRRAEINTLPEKKEFPFLLIFILLSLLLHLGLAYHYRAWAPASKALDELLRKKKNDIPVQIIELPPQKKSKEKPKPPPKKPSFLTDRNQQTKTETRTDASSPKALKVKPAPPKPQAKPQPKVKPVVKPKPKPERRPKTDRPDTAKPKPQIKAPDQVLAAEKKAAKKDVAKRTEPDIKKLFPSFEELTKITKEQNRRQVAPTGEQNPRLPNKLKRGTEISLNTLDYKFHSYYLALKRKIELVWEYPYKARRTGAQGRLLMRFVINQDGSLAEVKILRSSGNALLDSEAVRAIHNAAPYPPLPERMHSKRLAITATFEYSLSYRSVH
ncbi:energy transducer TonB [bacterium]|nr:energy transducer TonB [bacterium]